MKIILTIILLNLSALLSNAQQDSSSLSLDEFVFVVKAPIKISNDSISYLIDSFSQNPHAMTEDVIRKLPGVEITTGRINVYGKEVKKIYLNGKEYNSDPNTLIQNLPAAILDKIEFADWMDEDAQFTGIITERDEKVMHLKFKKQFNEGFTGKASVGYGTKERYQSSLFGNYMGSVFRLTATGNLNNTGVGQGSNNETSTVRTNNSPGITERKNISLNFSYDPNSRFSVNGSYESGLNNNFLEGAVLRTSFLPGDSTLYNTQQSTQERNELYHKLSLKSLYKFNKNTQLRSTLALSLNKSDKNNNALDARYFDDPSMGSVEYLFRRIKDQDDNSSSPSMSLNNSLQKKFSKKGRSFTGSVQMRYGKTENEAETFTSNQYTDPSQNRDISFDATSKNNSLNTGLNLQYTEPVSSNGMLISSYSFSMQNEHSSREVFADEDGTIFYDTVQSRSFININKEQRCGIFYQYHFNKFSVKAGAEAQYFNRNNERKNADSKIISQDGINYFPSLNSMYKFSKNKNLNFDYRGTIQTPNISQLQPIPDYTDSLNIFTGNPNLLPELRNNFGLTFNSVHSKTKNTVWLKFRYSFTGNQIINKSEISASKKITTPVNADGGFNTGASAGYSFQIIPKILRGSSGFNLDVARNISFINDRLLALTNYNASPNLRLQLSIKSYEGSLQYNYRYGSISSATQTDKIIQTNNITQEGSFSLPYNFRINYFLNYIFNNGFSKEFSKDFMVLNFSIDKTLTKSQKLYLRLQGFDVLNQYPTVQRVVGDNFIEDRMYNRLGSYYMLSLNYRFTYFPKN